MSTRRIACEQYSRDNDAFASCMDASPQDKNKSKMLVNKLATINDIRVSGGPFHNQLRAGTYGEVYDEIGWKFNLGIAEIKGRSCCEDNPLKCRYSKRVLIENWVEDRRDRLYIKYDNAPRLSEYGHIYKSEYATSFTKPFCNKARDILLKIKAFPLTAFPAHQPDLDIPVLKCSGPTPKNCTLDEDTVQMKENLLAEKRYRRHTPETGSEIV